MKEKKIVTLLKLFLIFAKIGLFTFGGGMSMLALFHNELVTKKKWISDEEMLDITAIAEATPGPIAINAATFIGYKQEGILGGLIATLGAITPSLIIITIISIFYEEFMKIELVQKAFNGIIAAVIVLLIFSVIKLSKGLKKSGKLLINLIFIVFTVAVRLIFPNFSTIFVILIGGVAGFLIYTFFIKDKVENDENQKEDTL